jgi:hypothetical protein
MSSRLNNGGGGGNEPKKKYRYYYCGGCKKYFTEDSYIPGSVCPFCSTPERIFSLGVLITDELVRDRLFIAIPKCTRCPEAYRCPECFGAAKKQPERCRFCPCDVCCREAVEFANGIKSGRISLWQAFREMVAEKGIKPGPMAKMMERGFEEEIPF